VGRQEVVPGETPSPTTLVLPFKIEPNAVLSIVKELRLAGKSVELDLRGKNIGKSLDWASKNGFTSVVIIGPQDLDNNQCIIKNLVTGEQNSTALDSGSIIDFL